MTFRFLCSSCQKVISGSDNLAGRRVRCPHCDQVIEAKEPVRGTVALVPSKDAADKTVLLEAVEVEEVIDPLPPVEVTESVEDAAATAREEAPPSPVEPTTRATALAEADATPSPLVAKSRAADAEMDMTPMVDVTFLLLIFFMVTATFTMQKSLEIPKPSDEDPSTNVVQEDPDEQSDFVTVKVDEYNTFFVTTVEWEEEAPSEQDLYVMLRRARDGDSTGTVPTKMRVEAHGEALHEKVVSAIDAGTANGFEEVQLTTIEDD